MLNTLVTLRAHWLNDSISTADQIQYLLTTEVLIVQKLGFPKLGEDTHILYTRRNKKDLQLAEAILVKKRRPTLNEQDEGKTRIQQIF